jgi:hypothetical protein
MMEESGLTVKIPFTFLSLMDMVCLRRQMKRRNITETSRGCVIYAEEGKRVDNCYRAL